MDIPEYQPPEETYLSLRDTVLRVFEKYKLGTQHALMRLIHKRKHCLDNSGVIAAVLTDLAKAYDCILQDLLSYKIACQYGLGLKASKLILAIPQIETK